MILSKKTLQYQNAQQSCWRKTMENDMIVDFCGGHCINMQFITDIPVVLILTPDISGKKFWNFPLQLYPLTKAAASNGVVYQLVSRIYRNSNHFITSSIIPTTSNQPAVFAYDGMLYNGYSQLQPGKAVNLMAGNLPPCPPGFYPHAVIYKLKGGLHAQQYFRDHQITAAKSYLDLTLHMGQPSTLDGPAWSIKSETKHTIEYNLLPEIPFTSTKLGKILHTQILKPVASPIVQETDFVDGDDQEDDDAIVGDIPIIDPENVDNMILDSIVTPSSSPLPSEHHYILCRCGVESNGYRETVEQDSVLCCLCDRYTHAGCLTRRIKDVVPEKFFCDECTPPKNFLNFYEKLPGLSKQILKTVYKRLL